MASSPGNKGNAAAAVLDDISNNCSRREGRAERASNSRQISQSRHEPGERVIHGVEEVAASVSAAEEALPMEVMRASTRSSTRR